MGLGDCPTFEANLKWTLEELQGLTLHRFLFFFAMDVDGWMCPYFPFDQTLSLTDVHQNSNVFTTFIRQMYTAA